jgi:hypothetical protein
MENVESVFLALYTFEMCIKILGMGLFFNKGAYLRDFWGMLDFTIVMSAYFTIIWKPVKQGIVPSDEPAGLNLTALRAFRVLRPLRTITTIKGLRVLVVSIFSAFPMLQQTVMVLFFFFLIFAIAGVQLLSGLLKQRCVDIATGEVYEDPISGDQFYCGGSQLCDDVLPVGKYFCGKCNTNPAGGITNLDNIFYALLMVFQCTTLEGWSDIQTFYQKTYSESIWLYFVSMVFIGAFFLMNLTLAVINAAFTKSANENKAKAKPDEVMGGEDGEIDLDEIDINQDDDTAGKGEIGISEFFIAKRAAKKMIEWLRLR